MKVAVTTFYTKSYDKLAEITISAMKDYCEKHGYYFNSTILNDDERCHFVKTKDTLELFDKEFDVVMAIECDALITNPEIKVESFIDTEHSIFLTKDINGPNSGIIICRNTGYAKEFLNFIQSKKDFYGDEQNLFEQYQHNCIKYLTHPSINSFPYKYYEPSYGKIGYKEGDKIEKPTHEQGDWEDGDFIMHLPGITLQKRIEIFNNYIQPSTNE